MDGKFEKVLYRINANTNLGNYILNFLSFYMISKSVFAKSILGII